MVGLGRIQGGEHLGPGQTFQNVPYSWRGEGIRCSTFIKIPIINGPARGPVLFHDWDHSAGPGTSGRGHDTILEPRL